MAENLKIRGRQDSDKFMARLPDGLRDRLKSVAADNHRSMNAEIIDRLELSFEAGSRSLDGEIASLIQKYVDAEVQRRLREIAAQIGGAA